MTGSRPSRAGGDEPPSAGDPDRLAFASLVVRQPRRGYRFSIDSVLLADFAAPLCGESVLDLGTGSGVVLLLLARLCPGMSRGVGVELQPELLEFARANIEANDLSVRLSALPGDFRGTIPGAPAGSFDLVVSNPPYRPLGEGRRNPDSQKEIARHEVACTMADVFGAAARFLSPRGRFAVLGLPRRLPELFALGAASGLFAGRLRFVHPFPGRPANLVLVAGSRRRGGGPEVVPPLCVYEAPGRYSPEALAVFRGLLGK
ncbi:MAG: tRNA1(Val) (adenine(37)-N6)-methyltransferase [Deltaproteobacteria bacterium]